MTCAGKSCSAPAVTQIHYLESDETVSYCGKCAGTVKRFVSASLIEETEL